jgi:hypothetical protein
MAILPTDIQILFTNYDIIAYFLNLASCSEHFISIKHRIFECHKTYLTNSLDELWIGVNNIRAEILKKKKK